MGVIPNPKMTFIFPISCILAFIFPIVMKYFPKCSGKGSFPNKITDVYSTGRAENMVDPDWPASEATNFKYKF